MIRALLLALALAGCEGGVRDRTRAFEDGYRTGLDAAHAIAQADPRTEADWPRLGSLTVTNATGRHVLIEQPHVVTLAAPDSTYTIPSGWAITIRNAEEYDD